MKSRNDLWLDAVTSDLAEPLPLRVRGRSMVPALRPGDDVLVEAVSADDLIAGDWVVVRNAEGGFLHRYLGTRHGKVLTKGDAHRGFDPLWQPEAVLGRAVEAWRDGRCFYRRTNRQVHREQRRAIWHRIAGDIWESARRLKALLLALAALLIGTSLALAAVTLVDFYAEVGDDRIILSWETASETNNLGFYVWRSLTEIEGYENISNFISSQDQGAGAFYEYEDIEAAPGVLYYYRLQDVPDDGTNGDFTEPITASIALPDDATPTFTPTPTNTPDPTPTDTPQPPPSTANVSFWAEETALEAGDCTTLHWQSENVKAVYLDGLGVGGDGAMTYCPCETETHYLSVTYRDDSTEDFEVTLDVTGECAEQTRTATPSATPEPTATPAPDSPTLTPTPVPELATPAATPVPTNTPVASLTPSVTPAATPSATASPRPVPSATPAAIAATATRGVVEGDSQGVEVGAALSVWLFVVGGIVGLGMIGAGLMMWKRQQ